MLGSSPLVNWGGECKAENCFLLKDPGLKSSQVGEDVMKDW